MLRSQAGRLNSLIHLLDLLLSAAVFIGVVALPGMLIAGLDADPFPVRLLALGLLASLTWPLLLEFSAAYESQRREPLWMPFARMAGMAAVASLVYGVAELALAAPVSHAFALVCSLAQFGALAAWRFLVFATLRTLRRRGHNYRNVLLVGSGPRALQARRTIESNPQWGLRILGFLEDSGTPVDPQLASEKVYKFADLPGLIQSEVVDEVVLACPRSILPLTEHVVALCAQVGVPVTLVSDLFGDYLPSPRSTRFGSLPALSFATVHHSPVKLLVKRGFDVVVSGTMLVLALPVLTLAAVAIKLTSPGPVLFRQVRCGLHGRRFAMLKLRTMYEDAEQRQAELAHLNECSGPVFKIRNDPRVTPVGRLLRRYSIDELPQLWNVLSGDMSLVGPRPPIPGEVDQYHPSQRRRLSMRPGLTCLWQVQGRNEIGFEDWVKLDLEYIDGWSLGTDLRILARTLPAVLRGTGAS
jgi:exopolysaccharide biosynthesis polyprenyl glycosylphosphotransferase